MRRDRVGEITLLQPQSFLRFSNVAAVITTRHGGVSGAPFDSFNLSTSVGDDPANVTENWRRLHKALDFDPGATVDAKQAQAGHVAVVRREHRGSKIDQVDGLVTDVTGMPLLLRFADCVPILLHDPVHQAIGVAHAGWRGTVAKVASNAVRAMGQAFGTRPHDLNVCIGPSIGPCCYEVGEDVRDRVREAFKDADELLIQRGRKVHLDLWAANAALLREMNVVNVEVAETCTADHTDDLYSWRRERARTGRFAALIALRE